ncbi:MAG: translation initiation factor IF-2, partial [Moraxellaceae bacterium]
MTGVREADMAEVTVAQLAEVVGIPVEKLLQQMKDAGLGHGNAGQQVSDDEKQTLLSHLKQSHGGGSDAEPKKITLRRKSMSTLKVSSSQGRGKTVNVEVRKKRTYVKRSVVESEASVEAEAVDNAEAAAKAEETAKIAAVKLASEKAASELAVSETVNVDDKPKLVSVATKTKVPEKSKAELEVERKAKEEKAAQQAVVKKEEGRIRQEARDKAEVELAKKTKEEAERIAKELAGRGEEKKVEVVLNEERDAIVKAAFEESLDREAKRTKRGPKRGAKKRQSVLSQPARALKLKSSGEHGFKSPTGPIVHEVLIPENITVSELAQRMSKKGGDVVKVLF